jgi:hypothetical protein
MVARVSIALVFGRTKVLDFNITMWYNIAMLEIFVC